MKKIFALIALILVAASARAQDYIRDEVISPAITRDAEIAPTGEANAICVSNTGTPAPAFALCSTLNITGKTVYYKPPEVTVATLPASHGLSIVTDGTTSTDCTVGGGSTKAWCWWNGSAWAALPGSGGGSGTITGVTAGTGLTGGGTSGTVALAVALSMRHTVIAGPPSPGSCQAGGEVVIDTTSVVNGITGVPYWCSAADENPVLFSALGDGIAQLVTDSGTITPQGATPIRFEGQDGVKFSANTGTSPKRIVLNYKLRGGNGTSVRVWDAVGTFVTQPSNDGVEMLSTSGSDVQDATIWGTVTGGLDTALQSEVITLNGTNPVPTARTDWNVIYAVELASAAAGTITVREASGDQTITQIAPGGTIAAQAQTMVIGSFGNAIGVEQLDDTSCSDGESFLKASGDWACAPSFNPNGGTLEAIHAADKELTTANSLANAKRTGDGVTPMCEYTDSIMGPTIRPCTASDRASIILDGFVWKWLDEANGNATMLTVDPAQTGNAKYTWGSGYRPTKQIVLTADSLYMQGCTLVTDSAFVTGGLVEPYITCGDSGAHGFHRSFPMPTNWDGGTITVTVNLINVNATPADNYEIDFSAIAVPLGTALATTIDTTGEQPATVDFDASGTCGGSACVQFAHVSKTTNAITVNGTPAGGNLLRIQGQIDADATTTAQVADVKIQSIVITYSIAEGF